MRPFAPIAAVATLLLTIAHASRAAADENYESWPKLVNPFPSTGGNGVMIDGYNPVVANGKCTTDFTAKIPDGTVYRNTVEFTATSTQGGILCDNGKWRSLESDAAGTTPFRVFIKDGIVRRPPE
ncbi:hypothetical protein [Terrarubrum flagellatum]|uniref:hypothetical protein n=1 Tax=Terrirubrum flagellatum TaxID=2895980 RepID=UPI003145153B